MYILYMYIYSAGFNVRGQRLDARGCRRRKLEVLPAFIPQAILHQLVVHEFYQDWGCERLKWPISITYQSHHPTYGETINQ